jgi:hypothetical protein
MKNIHVLKTDKPSRLQLNVNTKRLILFNNIQSNNESAHLATQNIYITSDEEIKKDEYYLGEDNNIYCLVTTVNFNGKKIILTTDQDLIKNGVQAIDDDFLEWFVKNPSCEEVEVERDEKYDEEIVMVTLAGKVGATSIKKNIKINYKLIIPKEEPKQETTADYIDRHIVQAMVEVVKQKMYSEEEVINIIYKIYDEMGISISLEDVVKQFKK